MSKIYILHENGIWVEPLRRQLESLELPFEEWNLVERKIDLDETPPEGVFYNRMSASSYTRGHRFSPELTAVVLNWLEAHGRRVVNNTRALQLEINKAAQYAALKAHGILTPRTLAAVGEKEIIAAAESFAPGPVILKPNRGGRGDGVILFETTDELKRHVASNEFESAVDGIMLLQEYIESPERYITRAEFIGGAFHYAVRVDTSDGFELCPADVCQIETPGEEQPPKFAIFEGRSGIANEQVVKYQRFLAGNGIEVAGIEFIIDGEGTAYTYDVNTNTNYNSDAEAADGRSGMGRLAEFLGAELRKVSALPSIPGLKLAV